MAQRQLCKRSSLSFRKTSVAGTDLLLEAALRLNQEVVTVSENDDSEFTVALPYDRPATMQRYVFENRNEIVVEAIDHLKKMRTVGLDVVVGDTERQERVEEADVSHGGLDDCC